MSVIESVSRGLLLESQGVGAMSVYPDTGRRHVVFTSKEMGRAQVIVLGIDQVEELGKGLIEMVEEMR